MEKSQLIDLLRESREALENSSNYWQAVASHYGPVNPTNGAEVKSLAIRDAAIAKIDAVLSANKVSQGSAAPGSTKPVTCPAGRVEVTGIILSTKIAEDRGYGASRKMLVELPNGARIYGTAPLCIGADQGNTVVMKATIEPSQRDLSFGIFTRPHIISTRLPSVPDEPAIKRDQWYQKI